MRLSSSMAIFVLGFILISSDPSFCQDTEIDDVVMAMTVGRSWVDTGLKAIILDDSRGFAYRLQGDRKGFFSFTVTSKEKKELATEFYKNNFFELPDKIWASVTDGTAETLMIAGKEKSHLVLRYMEPNAAFTAILSKFEGTVIGELPDAKEVTPELIAESLSAYCKKLDPKSPQLEEIQKWMKSLPHSPPTQAQLDQQFLSMNSNNPSNTPDSTNQQIENIFMADTKQERQNSPAYKKEFLNKVLSTFTTEQIKQYLQKIPFHLTATQFERALLYLKSRGLESSQLVPLLKNYLILGKRYAQNERPVEQTQSLIHMTRNYFPSCDKGNAIEFLEGFFCAEKTKSPSRKKIKSLRQLYLANGPKEVEMTKTEFRFLSSDCSKRFPKVFSCPKNNGVTDRIGTDKERVARAASSSLRCENDDDCIAIKNGCGFKKWFSNSPNVHQRFHCTCEKGPTVFGCFREGK